MAAALFIITFKATLLKPLLKTTEHAHYNIYLLKQVSRDRNKWKFI